MAGCRDGTSPHDWRLQSILSDANGRTVETYRCADCGATDTRHCY